jgi:hypothetical protein
MEAATAPLKNRIVPLDPGDKSTWKNIPCPIDLAPIQAELTRLGGLNEHGNPNFIIVWGQEYKTWDSGRMRIHFDDENIDAIHHPNRFACTPEVFARAAKWLEEREAERQQALMNLDFAAWNRHPDVALYLEANELKENWLRLPHEEEDLGRIARLMPDGWMYLNGLHTFEHIGQQCFYVLQYFREKEFNCESDWEDLRYGNGYFPETDKDEDFLDILGPYPAKGQYEHVAFRITTPRVVAEKHSTWIGETVSRTLYGYKEPTVEYVSERLKARLKQREQATSDQVDASKANAKRFRDFRDAMPANREKFQQEFRQKFNDAKPVGLGNPTNISANKSKVD